MKLWFKLPISETFGIIEFFIVDLKQIRHETFKFPEF